MFGKSREWWFGENSFWGETKKKFFGDSSEDVKKFINEYSSALNVNTTVTADQKQINIAVGILLLSYFMFIKK